MKHPSLNRIDSFNIESINPNNPIKPDPDPDPTKKDDPNRADPTRIEEPEKNDPTRIDDPPPTKPQKPKIR